MSISFPKVPSPQTLIADRPDDMDCSTQVVQHMREKISELYRIIDSHSAIQFDEVLEELHLTPTNYVDLLKISSTSPQIILQRDIPDMRINSYNPTILKIWKGNMDIQYIVDAISAVMYVCSYMMKAEKGMGDLLKRICKEVHSAEIRTQLKTVGRAFLDTRELCGQESGMRILSMPLIEKSRKAVFIDTTPKAMRIVSPKFNLSQLDPDEEDIFATQIHDRYAA